MQKLMGNREKGLLYIISAPAGTGKNTLVQMLMNEFSCVVESVSLTTRKPRDYEVNGVHYTFVSRAEFEEKIAADEFLECVELYGDYYGTSRKVVEKQLGEGKHVILVIDTQGAIQLMDNGENARFIFIQPPSLEELRERLTKRRTESPAVIDKRLDWAQKEIALGSRYDYQIINDDLQTAYQVLKSILIAEEHRTVKLNS